MAWRDRLLPASFRGVPFRVEANEGTTGRRSVLHEYPGRDLPFTEDLGRKARGFTLSAYVVGPDYMAARDALLDALEQPGPGELVHPSRGTLSVVCTDVRWRESADEGGMARFQLSFAESGRPAYPAVTLDRTFGVGRAADSLAALAKSLFSLAVTVEGVPEFVREALSGEVGGVMEVLGALGFPGADAAALAEFRQLAHDLAADLGLLVTAPNELAGRLADAVAGVRSLFEDGTDAAAVRAVTNLAPLAAYTPRVAEPATTPNRIAAGENRQAVADLVSRVALAETARATVARSFESYEQAVAARESLTGAIDAAAATAPDELYDALQALRAEVTEAVPPAEENLPRLASLTLAVTAPGLVVAYGLYDDAGRGEEIARRNRVAHPGFLPAGRPLEVLTDG